MDEQGKNVVEASGECAPQNRQRMHAFKICFIVLCSLVVFWCVGELAYRTFKHIDETPATWDEVSRAFCTICVKGWPVGSGVLVSHKSPGMVPERQIYLMTARHVAQQTSVSNRFSVILAQASIDNPARTMRFCTLQQCTWIVPLTMVDMAAVNITQLWRSMKKSYPDIGYIDMDSPVFGVNDTDAVHGVTAIRRSDFQREQIGLGTDLWFFGTSQEYWVSNLLLPDQPMVMRKGHIAWRNGSLRSVDTNQAEVICFEGTVQPGNSGGPVFVKVNRNGRSYPALVGILKASLGAFDRAPKDQTPTRAEIKRILAAQSRLAFASPLDDWLDYMNKLQADRQCTQAAEVQKGSLKDKMLARSAWITGSVFLWIAYLTLLGCGVIHVCIAFCESKQSVGQVCVNVFSGLIVGGFAFYGIVGEIRGMLVNGCFYRYSLSQIITFFILCVVAIIYAACHVDKLKHGSDTSS